MSRSICLPGTGLEASAAGRSRGRFVARLLLIAVALLAAGLSSWNHLRESNAAARSEPEPPEVVTAGIAGLREGRPTTAAWTVFHPLIASAGTARHEEQAASLLPVPAGA